MTKKDYVLLAQVLHDCKTVSTVGNIPEEPENGFYGLDVEHIYLAVDWIKDRIGEALSNENPRFDWNKWNKAIFSDGLEHERAVKELK